VFGFGSVFDRRSTMYPAPLSRAIREMPDGW
jgi:hypothetical protein